MLLWRRTYVTDSYDSQHSARQRRKSTEDFVPHWFPVKEREGRLNRLKTKIRTRTDTHTHTRTHLLINRWSPGQQQRDTNRTHNQLARAEVGDWTESSRFSAGSACCWPREQQTERAHGAEKRSNWSKQEKQLMQLQNNTNNNSYSEYKPQKTNIGTSW